MTSENNLVEKQDWMIPIGAIGYDVISKFSDLGSATIAFLNAYKYVFFLISK